jgi:hypothetical protein
MARSASMPSRDCGAGYLEIVSRVWPARHWRMRTGKTAAAKHSIGPRARQPPCAPVALLIVQAPRRRQAARQPSGIDPDVDPAFRRVAATATSLRGSNYKPSSTRAWELILMHAGAG